ncbi:hypothetical protein [Paenibacillus sp. LHD-38]|uniref:hypothetical protein n=1 Tax=Paenibacillus sp. LHD-38 TaxID=3072143 RepID=UPI002810587B|nr:hypothetical protein [Paenibacillus sp. LHD-38]MDQ8734164.1 hypothetical protein [Paenibacillus sp. LHD-38]
MKQSKAIKWQLGACGAFAVFLVFGSIQNSQAFQLAHALKAGEGSDQTIEQQLEEEDSVVDGWVQQRSNSRSERYGEAEENGGWEAVPEQDSESGSARGGLRSQTGRS